MSTNRSIALSQLPDSSCAEELHAGVSRLSFAPPLESAFRQHHLTRVRVRTRTWAVVTAVFALAFTALQVGTQGPLQPLSLLDLLILPFSLLVAYLPWSRFYLSHYLQIARFATPVACAFTAPFSALAVSQGQYEVAALFALQIVGVFQFTGLLFRAALFTCVAMTVGFAVGAVMWMSPEEAGKFIFTMALATTIGGVAVRDSEKVARTQFLEDRLLRELMERDPLTGLKNRRSFDEHLQRIWMQAQRDARTMAVLMVDADDFKAYNDTYGHQAGDDVLRRIGGALSEFGRRPLDLVARYGGEEFALIMCDVSPEHAAKVAEQLRAAVAAMGMVHVSARAAGVVTLSVGVAVGRPVLGRTPQGLLQLADEALYEAKAAGRNRVVVKGQDAYNALDSGVFHTPRQMRGKAKG